MATSKITELTSANSLTANDLFVIVKDPSGSPSTKKITVTGAFSNIASPAVFSNSVTISGNVTISSNLVSNSNITANNLFINYRTTPVTNTDTVTTGKLWFDNNHIYVAISNNLIKRVALSTF